MKKKILSVIILFVIASFFSLNKVNAETPSLSYYEKTSCVTIASSGEDGVFYASSVGHYDIINIYFGVSKSSLTISDNTWIHMKGIVSDGIYRLKVNANGSTCQSRLFDTSKPSNGLIKLNSDRTFEVHYKAKDFLATDSLNKLGFQIYVDGDDHITGSHNESLELLGIVFTETETYSDWATPVEREEHICNWDTKWTSDTSNHWHVCLNGCKTLNSYAEHTYVEGVCSVCGAEEPGELAFGVMTTDSQIVTIENALEGGSGKITFISSGTASISIPVENVLTTAHNWFSIKLKASDGVEIKAYADNVYMCADMFAAWNSEKYLETYDEFLIANAKVGEYLATLPSVSNVILPITGEAGDVVEIMDITFTTDGKHQFETPSVEVPNEGPVSNISLPSGFNATYVKNEQGEQTITYSESPKYKTFDIKVTEYDPTNTILEVVFEASDKTTVCFQINGKIDWSLGGHKAYPGERTSKVTIDLTSFEYELGSEFIVSIFLDATETVTETKSITFKSVAFKRPEPEPEGMYIGKPTSSNASCFDGALGDEVEWTYGEWSSVDYKINKYEQEYDVLAINMSVIKGMNLGIRVNFNEMVDGTLVESSEDIRNHWTNEGIFSTTGDIELVFFLKQHGIDGGNITSITFYFDPPTNTYIPNEGVNTCTIYSLELYKSSELELKELDIIAEAMNVDYTGKPIDFIAQNEYDFDMIIEYSSKNDTDWRTEAPVNVGTYDVRIKFLGNLTHESKVVNSTLTINKTKAPIYETDVYVDAETGVVTIANGVIASLSPDFDEESLIISGFIAEDKSVIYFYRPMNSNYHTSSDVLSIVVELKSKSEDVETPNNPTEPDNPDTPTKPENPDTTTQPENPETPGTSENPNTPDVNDDKDNTVVIVILSIVGALAIAGVVIILIKRKK